MFKTIFIICLVIYFFIYLCLAVRTKKPIKTVFSVALMGVLSMVIINITSKYSGVYIPVNPISVGCSASLGIVGTIGLVIIQMIMV